MVRAAVREDDDLKAVFNALRKLVRAVRLSSSEVHAALGVSGSQLFVMRQLSERPSLSLGELAKLTHTDHSSVSVVVARLVRRRLVSRKTSTADKRRVELALSAQGKELLKGAPEVLQQRLVRSLKGFTPAQLRTLRGLLELVVRDIGFDPEPAEMFLEPIR